MKRLILAFTLAASIVTAAPVVLPEQATQASAALAYGYYEFTDGFVVYTYLYQWPGTWSLVGVRPA